MNKPMGTKSVFNPTSEDLRFQWNSASYVLKAGQSEDKWPDYLAEHAAKKLADKNTMTSNPEEHKVLMGAYLENSDPEVIAKGLGINLTKIRKEASTKAKEKARVLNLEAQMLEMRKEMMEMKADKVVKEVKEVKKVVKVKSKK